MSLGAVVVVVEGVEVGVTFVTVSACVDTAGTGAFVVAATLDGFDDEDVAMGLLNDLAVAWVDALC